MLSLVSSSAFASVVDACDTPLKFKITSDSTAKLIKDESYKHFESLNVPEKVRIGGKEYSVTEIGRNAFVNCKTLKNVEIASSVKSIGNSAFYKCKNLTNVEIPANVTSIELGAFAGCKNLTSMVIPESVTNIGNSAFGGCKNLDLVINNSKKKVRTQYDSFTNCKSVKYSE